MPPENIRMYVLYAFYCNRLNVKFQVVILETVPGSDEVREWLSNYVFSMNDSKTAREFDSCKINNPIQSLIE